MSDSEYAAMIPDLIGVGVATMIENAEKLGILWQFRLGTVTTTSPLTVTLDGDDNPVNCLSFNTAIAPNTRVGIFQLPRGLNLLVMGSFQTRNLVGRVESDTSTAAVGAVETVVFTTPSIDWKEGHVYELKWRSRVSFSTALTMTYRYRQTDASGTSLYASAWASSGAAGYVPCDSVFVQCGFDTTFALAMTLVCSTGNVTCIATSADIRYLEVYDIGASTDYPLAPSF